MKTFKTGISCRCYFEQWSTNIEDISWDLDLLRSLEIVINIGLFFISELSMALFTFCQNVYGRINENSKFERSSETVVRAFLHSRNRIRERIFFEGT